MNTQPTPAYIIFLHQKKQCSLSNITSHNPEQFPNKIAKNTPHLYAKKPTSMLKTLQSTCSIKKFII